MPISKQDFVVSGQQSQLQDNLQRDQIVSVLRQRLSPEVLDMWFDGGDVVQSNTTGIRVVADSEFKLNRISQKFGTEIRQAVRSVMGLDAEVAFELQGNSDANDSSPTVSLQTEIQLPSIKPEQEQPENPSVRESVRAPRKPGTESFWFGESNRLVQAGIDQMFQHPGQMTPLVLYGPAGCGKTHLLESVVVDARRKHNLKRCVYLSAEQFTSNFVQSLRGTGLPVFRRKYRDLDLLAIDDVQFFAGKNATLGEFQHTVDCLIRNGKQVILASDRPPIDLGRLGEEITARMMSGLVCPLNYPDAEGRKKIVREICRQRDIQIHDDVVKLVGENLARDVRRLTGAINRIHALSIATEQEITVASARECLMDLFSISAAMTSLSSIEKCVCSFCGVKPAELKSGSRQKRISAARMLAMYLSRQHTRSACSEIGEYYGGRSHSTVIAAQKKVASWVQSNAAIDLPHAKYPAKDAIGRIESDLRIG